jgi:hypothetical protein
MRNLAEASKLKGRIVTILTTFHLLQFAQNEGCIYSDRTKTSSFASR